MRDSFAQAIQEVYLRLLLGCPAILITSLQEMALADQHVNGRYEVPFAEEAHDREARVLLRVHPLGVAAADAHRSRKLVIDLDGPGEGHLFLLHQAHVKDELAVDGPLHSKSIGEAGRAVPCADRREELLHIVVGEDPPLGLDDVDVLEVCLSEGDIHPLEAPSLLAFLGPRHLKGQECWHNATLRKVLLTIGDLKEEQLALPLLHLAQLDLLGVVQAHVEIGIPLVDRITVALHGLGGQAVSTSREVGGPLVVTLVRNLVDNRYRSEGTPNLRVLLRRHGHGEVEVAPLAPPIEKVLDAVFLEVRPERGALGQVPDQEIGLEILPARCPHHGMQILLLHYLGGMGSVWRR
mmetsp:Transcript_40712/g.86661  ORF Transcript_40712/g.86661 Transcript_40712/m.86661 type:complete len:351 (-) Transcript_40712:274-1326(-)